MNLTWTPDITPEFLTSLTNRTEKNELNWISEPYSSDYPYSLEEEGYSITLDMSRIVISLSPRGGGETVTSTTPIKGVSLSRKYYDLVYAVDRYISRRNQKLLEKAKSKVTDFMNNFLSTGFNYENEL